MERKRVAAVEGKGALLKTLSRSGEERCELRCARNRRLITNLAALIGLALSGGPKEPRPSNAAARIVHVTTAQRRRTLTISHDWCNNETIEWTWSNITLTEVTIATHQCLNQPFIHKLDT